MHRRNLTYTIVVSLVALGFFAVGRLSAASGTLEPPAAPNLTSSYTLEDIYARLVSGDAGTPSTFTEPSSGPGAGTMHTLNDIMARAPVTQTNGTTSTQVLTGTTFWGLTSEQWGLTTGTRPWAPVPWTGQTTIFTIGDDGDLRKGVAWPNPRFTDNGNGTVTDNLTGLIWLKNADCLGAQSWGHALISSHSLASGACGLTDGSAAGQWRLPNMLELSSLMNFEYNLPALAAGHPFTLNQAWFCWSTTTYAGKTSFAWGVNIGSGGNTAEDKNNSWCVWPVRDVP